MTRRKLRSVAGRVKPWAITVALVAAAAAFVLVPAASATLPYSGSVDENGNFHGISVTAVDGSTLPAPTEIDATVGPAFGTDIITIASGATGSRSLSYVPGPDGIADWPNGASSFYLDLSPNCSPEEAIFNIPYTTLDPLFALCWSVTFTLYEGGLTLGMGPLEAGSLGFVFVDVATGADGTTPVVFDHWDVTGAAPMGLVLPGQTTPGVAGYCTSGDRGYWTGRALAYQSYVNEATGVGMDVNDKAVYMPANPDTSAPEITFPSAFDCADFVSGATQSTTGLDAVYHFNCDDPGFGRGLVGPTGVASCTGEVNGTTVHDGDRINTSTVGDYTLTVTAVDNRNNTRTKSATYHVLSNDDTPPTTTISLTPSSPNGNNSWYTSSVGVSISASDGSGTGVAETRCVLDPASPPASFDALPSTTCAYLAPDANVTSDGQHTVYAASKDNNGNEETPVSSSFKIDGTAPTVTCPSPIPTFALGSTGNQVTASFSDLTSGPLTSTVSAAAAATSAGVHSVNVTGQDNAGNQTVKSCSYLVGYNILPPLGFYSPAPSSKWKPGQTVPIKIALGNASGVRISDAEAAALVSGTCRVKFFASGVQTLAATCMKYDSSTHQFVYNWKLGNQTGAETLTVTISYPSTNLTTTKSESITITK
jgi:hypothetical protein